MKGCKLNYKEIVEQLVCELGIALKVKNEPENTLPFILWKVRELVEIKKRAGYTEKKYIDVLERIAYKHLDGTNAKQIEEPGF